MNSPTPDTLAKVLRNKLPEGTPLRLSLDGILATFKIPAAFATESGRLVARESHLDAARTRLTALLPQLRQELPNDPDVLALERILKN